MPDLGALADESFCYLTTTGRVTGRPHEIEIWFALVPETLALYMLSGGGDRSDWVKNLRRNPEVTVRIAEGRFAGVAREAGAAVARREVREQSWSPGELAPQGAARGGRPHAVRATWKNRGEDTVVQSRAAGPEDAQAIARIYNEGIEERIATFETSLRTAREIEAWFDGTHPVVVVEEEGEVISFANTTAYSPRACYSGVAEFSVYTAGGARSHGAGTLAMKSLMQAAEEAGFWELVARVFVENESSRKLLLSLGFREVGIHEKHARLDGVWRGVG